MFRVELISDDENAAPLSLDLVEFVQQMVKDGAVAELNKTGSAMISSYVSDADIHNNSIPVLFRSDKRIDEPWQRNDNVFSLTGKPSKVNICINIQAPDEGVSNYWSRPKLRVLDKEGEVVGVVDNLVMQQNTAYDGDGVIVANLVDELPLENPTYTFEWFRKDNRISTLEPEEHSRITLEAFL